MNLNTSTGRLRLVAILEGISYLLLFITMPLKYKLAITEPNYIVGMAHGVLFLVYVAMCLHFIFKTKCGLKNAFIALVASVIPFGTFYAEAKVFKNSETKNNVTTI